MAGLIKQEDIELVRSRARIDEVVEQYVTLRNAGGGSRKGLCPFHDEKSPSFQVTPARGYYYCFGCQASGDVFKFLIEYEGVTFAESVERLASKYGITLRYDESGAESGPRRDPQQRSRMLKAHKIAGDFFAEQLSTPDALAARQFLDQRGFDREAAETFGVGFAPRGGEALTRHLREQGFSDDELVTASLARKGSRGIYDWFRGRLLWPIRETNGDIVGFGARRIFDDDRIEAKYLNTGESPIYKKSHVLYGLDLARREIQKSGRAVIVEGYTDVMACHLAGVTSAVATCGTAFGADQAAGLNRLLHNGGSQGEVVFTFDGDAAGQAAALKVFALDDKFTTPTYVAVEKTGMDPCDLRLSRGDAAVRELVATRTPLNLYVLDNVVGKYDLDRGDQRIEAIRDSLGLLTSVRDASKVESFIRDIASKVGVTPEEVRRERPKARAKPAQHAASVAEVEPRQTISEPSLGEPRFVVEREALMAIVKYPRMAREALAGLDADDFHHRLTKEVWNAISTSDLPASDDQAWIAGVADALPTEDGRRVLAQLAVEDLRIRGEVTPADVGALVGRLQLQTIERRIVEIKSRLQRTNPVTETEVYNRMFGELIAVEARRRELRRTVFGDT